MTKRQVPFYRPEFPEAQRRAAALAIEKILGSGQLMMGPYKDKLEEQFRAIAGTSHAVSLNSATTGLQIALQHFGVKDREVLVPAGAFLTDASAVMFAGGRPVLVDINPATLALDLEDLGCKVTSNTRGIIWVHLTGLISADWRHIQEFARSRGLFLIEDASHAHGASIEGRSAGSLGDAGIFSFYPTKVVTAGTGGMLTTNDPDLARFAEEMRMFGKDSKGEIVHLGNDWFLDEIRACVGYHHALDLARQLARRRELAARYMKTLANQRGLTLFCVPASSLPSWYHFCVVLDDGLNRAELSRELAAKDGIASKPIYRPLHHEAVFKGLADPSLNKTEHILDKALALPMFAGMSDDEVDYVCERLIARVRELV